MNSNIPMTSQDLDVLVKVKKALLRTPYANEIPSRTHVRVHCPLCGDSLKHPDGTHCYVNIEGNKPVSYYCHLCNEGGWVGSSFLRALGITNLDVITGLRKWNNACRTHQSVGIKTESWRRKKRELIGTSAMPAVPIYDRYSKAVDDKLKYIGARLGIDVKFSDIPELKIVTSLMDFLDTNGLRLNKKLLHAADLIERNYVGFLSMDCGYIVFRNTKDDGNLRYINYPVFGKNVSASKSYVIPSNIDIMSNDVTFNIAEGIFDILGCYYHINRGNRDNHTIYGAIAGSGFKGFIRRIIRIGFIGNLHINLYSDRDKSKEYYRQLRDLSPLCKSLDVWYNNHEGEKDIGVPADRIDVTRIKMRF